VSPCESCLTPVVFLQDASGCGGARALGEFPAVNQALAPLVRGAARTRTRTRLRLLLGNRRYLLYALCEPIQRVDLDTNTYADAPTVAAYARSCLIHLSDESPYRGQPEKYLDAVAEAIAEAAGNSFLVAFITSEAWRYAVKSSTRDRLTAELAAETDRHAAIAAPGAGTA